MDNERIEQTILKFRNGSSCAQAVLSTYLPYLGISELLAHKMGAGLGGGIGQKQYVCGALNAGAIVLSTHSGNEINDDLTTKETSIKTVREMIEQFENKFGTAQCAQLLGIDINTEAGKTIAEEKNIFRNICDSCVSHVCQYLENELFK